MFRDAKEELKRLEAQLLAEEEESLSEEDILAEEELPEEEIDDEQLQKLLQIVDSLDIESEEEENVLLDSQEETEEDPVDTDEEAEQLRNLTTEYHAYNSDTADENLNTYSEEVRNAETNQKGKGSLVALLVVLIGALGGLIWWMLKLYGVIG